MAGKSRLHQTSRVRFATVLPSAEVLTAGNPISKINGNPTKSIYVYSKPEWTALICATVDAWAGLDPIMAQAKIDLPPPRDRQSAAYDFAKRRVLAALNRSLDRDVTVDDRATKSEAGASLWWRHEKL